MYAIYTILSIVIGRNLKLLMEIKYLKLILMLHVFVNPRCIYMVGMYLIKLSILEIYMHWI